MSEFNDMVIRALERLEDKMDSLQEETRGMKTEQSIQNHHLADYNESLKEHMRRTSLLEGRVDSLEVQATAIADKESFIQKHWKRLATIAGIISALASAWYSIIQINRKP